MDRALYKELLQWKGSQPRKPLLLKGARQVGKTHLLKTFGQQEFSSYHYINFEEDKKVHSVFEKDFFVTRILDELSLHLNQSIRVENDLLIFDEIQQCPKALTSLKYFCENRPDLAICAAGSLLGVKLTESFPVGKVQFLELYPFTFLEFLNAIGDKKSLAILKSTLNTFEISEIAHERLWQRLKDYYFIGGMPEVILAYIKTETPLLEKQRKIRSIQQDLINSYHKDFAKHAGKINAFHIVSVFENIPLQLSKNLDDSVKRYRFKDVLPKKKSFADLQGPIDWLVNANLALKVKICNRAELPLQAFCKDNIFKLYLFDIGLLGCLLDLPVAAILDDRYGIVKGFFSENYVATQLVASGIFPLYSWAEQYSEIEFLQHFDGKIVPLEVKAGKKTQAKSLKQFFQKYSPHSAVILSGKPMKIQKDNPLQNLSLYQAGMLQEFL